MKLPPNLLLLCCTAALPAMAHADEIGVSEIGVDKIEVVAAPIFPAGVHLSARNALSSSSEPGWAKFASGTGSALFLAAGVLLPLATDGKEGAQHSLRTFDALAVSTILTSGLKIFTHEKRPDGSDFKSFPSGHASAAFTVATMQASYHPKQALFWYGGASLIAYSRVKLHRHYTRDVVAGAAVGYFTSRLELSRPHGLILAPFIHSRREGGGNGATLTMNF